jgi:hypothetical protein
MTLLNTLEQGARCVVTTRDLRVVTGEYLGIEVTHGDRSILVASRGSTHSIPFESLLSASGPQGRAA